MGASLDEKLTDEERKASIKAFEELGLCTQLAEAAASLGWKQPSIIQKQAIPPLLQGEDGTERVLHDSTVSWEGYGCCWHQRSWHAAWPGSLPAAPAASCIGAAH